MQELQLLKWLSEASEAIVNFITCLFFIYLFISFFFFFCKKKKDKREWLNYSQ